MSLLSLWNLGELVGLVNLDELVEVDDFAILSPVQILIFIIIFKRLYKKIEDPHQFFSEYFFTLSRQ